MGREMPPLCKSSVNSGLLRLLGLMRWKVSSRGPHLATLEAYTATKALPRSSESPLSWTEAPAWP